MCIDMEKKTGNRKTAWFDEERIFQVNKVIKIVLLLCLHNILICTQNHIY